MKQIYVILLALVIATNSKAQISEIEVVIVTCKAGILLLDGVSLGAIDADDAVKQRLSVGEHYLQLKTNDEKINHTFTADPAKKEIIKIGCGQSLPSSGDNKAIRVIDKEVALSGMLSDDVEQNIVGFDTDDIINLNCAILNKKGKATLSLREYETGREIFRREDFNKIEAEKIKIPAKGIYYFNLYTDALLGKTVRLTIDRIPAANGNPNFNTAVRNEYDTSFEEVLNTEVWVYSRTNLTHPNKTTVSINLPTGTQYWAYWLGVGQEAQQNMKAFTSTINAAGRYLTTNPVALLGMRLLTNLPMLQAPETVNYYFMSSENAALFKADMAFKYYTFKYGSHVTTDYAIAKNNISNLVLAMENDNVATGYNVTLKVVAFKVKHRYILAD